MYKTLLLFLMLIFISPIIAEEVSVQVKDLKINGTLEMPVSNNQVPLAIIIAGSGPTDRDGNSIGASGKNNSLKYLSEKLLSQGIASYTDPTLEISEQLAKEIVNYINNL